MVKASVRISTEPAISTLFINNIHTAYTNSCEREREAKENLLTLEGQNIVKMYKIFSIR